jgi:hypothetical protein
MTATFKTILESFQAGLIHETQCGFNALFSFALKRRSILRMKGGFIFNVNWNYLGNSRALGIRDSALEIANGICFWVHPEMGVHNLCPMGDETNQEI